MALIVPEQSQRPYRFGMTLLCIGALFNWLGLADSYTEPVPAVRYIGVGLIAVGAALICLAMCCWMRAVQDPMVAREMHNRENVGIQVINIEQPDPRSLEKPPDYSSVVDFPPSYEDAVKELDANKLLYPSLDNNNYQDTIKNEDDALLITSQLDGTNQENSAQLKQLDEEKDVIKETNTKGVTEITANANVNLEKIEDIERTHSIVEIPESMINKTPSQPNISDESEINRPNESTSDAIRTNHSTPIEAALSSHLVSDETSKSNSLAKVFRKSFRSLRKTTLPPTTSTEAINKSMSCDIENTNEEANR